MRDTPAIFQRIRGFSGGEQCLRLLDALEECDALLDGQGVEAIMPIYLEVAYLLAENVCIDAIWEWLGKRAERATEEEKEAMRSAILESLPEEPRSSVHLRLVWKNWGFEGRKWMVEATYHTVPEQMAKDLRIFWESR